MKNMVSRTALALLLALPWVAPAQEFVPSQPPVSTDSALPAEEKPATSLDGIEELLERFSETTLDAIEKEMNLRLNRYEDEMKERDATAASQPKSEDSEQYMLVFQIPGVSDEISIVTAGGEYKLETKRKTKSTTPDGVSEQTEYSLKVSGEATPVAGSEEVQLAFEGTCEVTTTSVANGVEEEDSKLLSFDGAARVTPSEKRELVREGETSVTVLVSPIPAESARI
ncbi:MAG: hypothetical protein AMXMBFR84_29910 [Candidatus Hydrogenedentota bacterium]